MPKLSQAKRHRKNQNLAVCCSCEALLQTPRRVSEEDIQNNENTPMSSLSQRSRDPESVVVTSNGARLKRPAPSNCLADLARIHLMQEDLIESPTSSFIEDSVVTDNHSNDTPLSPIWGHFVDVVLENEEESFIRPLPYEMPLYHQPGDKYDHRPYFAAKRSKTERKPIRSTSAACEDSSIEGFLLQDPSSLREALARLQM